MGMKQNSVQWSFRKVMAAVREAPTSEDTLDAIETHGGLHEAVTTHGYIDSALSMICDTHPLKGFKLMSSVYHNK